MLERLDAIAGRLAATPGVQALLALGSVGEHTQRLDEHSDLDFFVITSEKAQVLADLTWLGDVEWAHRNTDDGYQALAAGVFCEFAVFTAAELSRIPFEPGRVVWARAGFDVATLRPKSVREPTPDWLADEVLAYLYVGLHRWLRGEKLSAMRFVQGEALDNLLRLHGADDPFAPARRAERLDLPWDVLAGGYDATPESAQTILSMLDVQNPMRVEVERLLRRATTNSGD